MLRKDIPIIASPESIVITKGMQDTGVTSLETDTAYFSPRQPTDDLGLYLSSVAGLSYQGRDFCCTEKPFRARLYEDWKNRKRLLIYFLLPRKKIYFRTRNF